jgi:hypothetical protein
MKKVLIIMVAALLAVPLSTSAQQKKVVQKRATTTAKRTTPVRKKPAAQPVNIQMDEPCIAGGALAFNGIPINLPSAEMASELKSQGFVFKKDQFGNERWHGKAFGVDGEVYVGTNPAVVTFTEKKSYNKATARKRVNAYKDAFEEMSGCKASESTMNWNSDEGGMVIIPVNSSRIQINYANQDEVEFSSNLFTISITYQE